MHFKLNKWYGITWSWCILLGVLVHFYNKHLDNVYKINGNRITILKAFEIISDRNYMIIFFLGILTLIMLISVSIYTISHSYNDRFNKIIVPLINIILFVMLIVIYWNPIFLAFAMVAGVGGLFVLGSSN